MRTRHRSKRSDLFLVRFWAEDASMEKAMGNVERQGTLLRVVDGESHRFNSLQELMDLLKAMLSNNEGRQRR